MTIREQIELCRFYQCEKERLMHQLLDGFNVLRPEGELLIKLLVRSSEPSNEDYPKAIDEAEKMIEERRNQNAEDNQREAD